MKQLAKLPRRECPLERVFIIGLVLLLVAFLALSPLVFRKEPSSLKKVLLLPLLRSLKVPRILVLVLLKESSQSNKALYTWELAPIAQSKVVLSSSVLVSPRPQLMSLLVPKELVPILSTQLLMSHW